jgi:hypothetical protein
MGAGPVDLPRIAGIRILLDAAGKGPNELEMESTGLERRRLPEVGDRDDGPIGWGAEGASPRVGGCAARDSLGVDHEIGFERLSGAVRRLDSLIGGAKARQVVVHGRSLAEASERLLVEWAVYRAAAVIIPTAGLVSVGDLGRAVFELRPSILHGSARELAEWAATFELAEGGRRAARKRFASLRWVIVTGPEQLRHPVTSFYTQLGAAVVTFEDAWLFECDRLSSFESAD